MPTPGARSYLGHLLNAQGFHKLKRHTIRKLKRTVCCSALGYTDGKSMLCTTCAMNLPDLEGYYWYDNHNPLAPWTRVIPACCQCHVALGYLNTGDNCIKCVMDEWRLHTAPRMRICRNDARFVDQMSDESDTGSSSEDDRNTVADENEPAPENPETEEQEDSSNQVPESDQAEGGSDENPTEGNVEDGSEDASCSSTSTFIDARPVLANLINDSNDSDPYLSNNSDSEIPDLTLPPPTPPRGIRKPRRREPSPPRSKG